MKRVPLVYLILCSGLVATVAVYFPQFDGYWLGDDFGIVAIAHQWSLQGDWGALLAQQFFQGADSAGHFFRPLTLISLHLNYQFSASHYAGWFLPNLLVHLLNGLLVFSAVRRLLATEELTGSGHWAAAYASLAFLLCPFLAEGVYWICARSDQWVTLLSLIGLNFWVGTSSATKNMRSSAAVWVLPLALFPALLFKESAVVLPFQIALLWWAVPSLRDKHRSGAVLACFALLGLFFIWRIQLFGDPFSVYLDRATRDEASWLGAFFSDLASLGPWLKGLMGEQFFTAACLLSLQCFLLVGGIVGRWLQGRSVRLPFAIVCAAGGLLLATFLNLGGLAASGEGGRLLYSALAWLFIASGVALGALCVGDENKEHSTDYRLQRGLQRATKPARRPGVVVVGVMIIPVLLSLWLSMALVLRVHETQVTLRTIVAAIPELIARQSERGKGILLIPNKVGPVIAFRNGQGALVSPPLLDRDRLDEMVPSLLRHLKHNRDSFLPAWVACWVADRQQMEIIWTADSGNIAVPRWPRVIRKAARSAGCQPI